MQSVISRLVSRLVLLLVMALTRAAVAEEAASSSAPSSMTTPTDATPPADATPAAKAAPRDTDTPLPADDEATGDVFDILNEERIVSIGAGGRVTSVREAPGSLWTLDARTLRLTAASSLYDVMRQIPGQRTLEISGAQMEQNLRFEGSFPENQTLVLVNGQSVLADSIGIFDRSLLNLRDIERVEIVFGPSSTLYGANAFSGVINIITRKPVREGVQMWFAGDGGFTSGAPGNIGENAYRFGGYASGYAETSTGWKSGGIRISAGGGYMPTFGLDYVGYRRPVGEPVVRAAGRFDLVQDVGAWQLRLQADAAYKRSPYQTIVINDTQQLSVGVNGELMRERLAGVDDKLTIMTWARLFRLTSPDFIGNVAPVPLDANNWTVEVKADYALPTFYNNAIAVGTQLRASINDSQVLAPIGRQQYLIGLYAEDTYRPITPLLLTAGIRLDTREGPGTRAFRYFSVSPRASVVWLINDNHTLRGEYASAFRTPTAVERSATLVAGDGTVIVVGNPNLENERVHAGSLAWLGRFGWLGTRLELFAATTLNNIVPYSVAYQVYANSEITEFNGQPLNADPRFVEKIPYYYTNVPRVPIIPGALVRLDASPVPGLRASVSYSLIPAPRNHYVNLGFDWTPGAWELSANAYFLGQDYSQSQQDRPARIIVNLRVGRWLDVQRRWLLALSGMNLIDARFFITRRNVPTVYWRDGGVGERIGPRAFATLEYHYDSSPKAPL